MKAIFLDIDGVICLDPPDTLDAGCMSNLKRIAVTTGAQIVLSSVWRLYKRDLDLVESALALHDLKLFGCTRELLTPSGNMKPRHTEIVDFLQSHPEITRSVVIDDNKDAAVADREDIAFFQTSYRAKGLNAKVMNKVIEFLGEENESETVGTTEVERVDS